MPIGNHHNHIKRLKPKRVIGRKVGVKKVKPYIAKSKLLGIKTNSSKSVIQYDEYGLPYVSSPSNKRIRRRYEEEQGNYDID